MRGPHRLRTLLVGAVTATTVLTVAGCGSGDDTGRYDADGTSPAEQEQASGATLQVREDTAVGKVVADAEGYTLYVFTQDASQPPTSTCVDACADRWPPALVKGAPTLDGVREALVGQLERNDGASQLTLAGWPLYRYSGDVAPGDVNGHTADGAWYAVAPDGSRITRAPAHASASPDSSADGGYGGS